MTKRGFLTAMTGLAALTLVASPARAQLYNNGLPNGSGGNEMTQWVQAEDFTLGSGATLTSVTFWASVGVPGYGGSIFWQIYSNGAGVPGSVLNSGLAAPATTLYSGANCCGILTGMQLDFALPSIVLAPGTYWLGLHNGPLSTTARQEFYWATTNNNATGRGEEDIDPFGAGGWVNNGSEHAFQLNATTTLTPEPASMLMMATGLIGLGGGRLFRRRRKTA